MNQRLLVSLLFSVLLLLSPKSVRGQPLADDSAQIAPPGRVLVANGNLIDVETGKVREDVSLLIENGHIQKIGKNLPTPAGATVVDARGKWLLPGLIDSHIHLFQSGGLYTRPDGIDLTKYRPYETERKWLRDNMGDLLRRYLACGITTVIDVGGPMYQFAYRDRYNQRFTSPQILLTGPLTSTYQPAASRLMIRPFSKRTRPKKPANRCVGSCRSSRISSKYGLSSGEWGSRASRCCRWYRPLLTKPTKPG